MEKWNLKNGKFHGQYKTFFENGQLETSKLFKEDKAHGLSTGIMKMGSSTKTRWNNGKIDDLNEQYYENGQLEFSVSIKKIKRYVQLNTMKKWHSYQV